MRERTCTECRFFGKAMRWSNVSGKMVEAMECRHNTPGDSGWPLVLNTDWCGALEPEQIATIGVTP